MPIKISIYEDNYSLRDVLTYLVMGTGGFELIDSSPDATHILEQCTASKPDVILMDIDMPGITGIEATRLVKDKYPDINIMILTMFEDRDKIFDALCAGATGYLLKKSTSIEIINAIEELHQGGSPMSGEIARKVLGFFSKPLKVDNNYQLSPRELDILKCLVNGDSYKMAANACFISIGTVYTHINSIYKKLHVNSKSEAVVKAIKERLV